MFQSFFSVRLRHYLVLFLPVFILLPACTGLAGEPDVVATLPPRPTVAAFNIDVDSIDADAGAAIFAERCAECHGINGEGGTQVVNGQTLENLPNFTDAGTSADNTLEDYYNIITNGLIDRGKLMPGFSSLSDDERAAVAYYVYTLHENTVTADTDSIPAPVSTEDAAPQATSAPSPATDLTMTVSGQIQHNRENVSLPDNLDVSLTLINMTTFEQTLLTGTADAAGNYQFDDVPFNEQFAYLVRVPYGDRIFSSTPQRGDPETLEMTIPVTVYDVTNDPTVIEGQFVSMRILPGTGTIQGLQVMGFSNTSADVFTTDTLIAEDIYAGLRLPLPRGSSMIPLSDTANRYIPTEDGTAVYDTAPVFPTEEYIAQVPFEFPHEQRSTIEFSMEYTLNGTFEIFVAQPLTLEDTEMTLAETFTDEQTGLTFDIYTTPLALAPGETFTYTIVGETAVAASPHSVETSTEPLPGYINSDIIIVVIGVTILVMALFITAFMRFSTSKSAEPESLDQKTQLIQQIAKLDERFQSGEIEEADYQKQRDGLKSELMTLMQDEQPPA